MDKWLSQAERLANPIHEIACASYPLIGFKLNIISIVVVEKTLSLQLFIIISIFIPLP